MKKKILSFVLLLMVFHIMAQETTKEALKLVKVCHEKEIAKKMQFINEMHLNPNKDFKTGDSELDEVYKQLAAVYQEKFTPQEITSLIAFYNSPVGIKSIENQAELYGATMTIINKWEMKQQGIVIEEPKPFTIEDEEQLLACQKEDLLKNGPPKAFTIPKIRNLEDLKKLLKKEPNLMGDPRLFEEIMGKEEFQKLFMPQIGIDQEPKEANTKMN
jgi:hypothetical protein